MQHSRDMKTHPRHHRNKILLIQSAIYFAHMYVSILWLTDDNSNIIFINREHQGVVSI